MMSNEKQMIVISGFMGFAIGTVLMMVINVNKEQTINYCLEGEIQEIELSVCEECWYDVFDGGNEYQFTN
jgi:hypothetical protein|tara:strand:+ start:1283 stop:1492 length:210 start_codon:yes stop_codon:yes gene_type:complete